jgi:hypothetical protein
MLKRPLHAQFGPKVLAGIKRTTIRDTPWPLGKPIMLYHWSGKPYASPQQDVAAVKSVFTCPITIAHIFKPGSTSCLHYLLAVSDLHNFSAALKTPPASIHLWQLEGFDSRDAMDAWFRPLIKPGQTLQKHLMLFKLLPTEN